MAVKYVGIRTFIEKVDRTHGSSKHGISSLAPSGSRWVR